MNRGIYMKNIEEKRVKMILLILLLICYFIVSVGAVYVIVVKQLSFLEGILILSPLLIGTIVTIIINAIGKNE